MRGRLAPPKRNLRIRLRGIDAPETLQPIGKKAKAQLEALTRAKPVYMREVDVDPFGRITAYLYLRSANQWTCINLRLVRDGLAYAYRGYGGDAPDIQKAEAEAKSNGVACGLRGGLVMKALDNTETQMI